MDKKIRVMFYASAVLTAINLVLLTSQFSPAIAKVAGMDDYALRGDADFRKAVENIVEDCRVTDGTVNGGLVIGIQVLGGTVSGSRLSC